MISWSSLHIPAIAQLAERRTVEVYSKLSLGQWFKSASWDLFFSWWKLKLNFFFTLTCWYVSWGAEKNIQKNSEKGQVQSVDGRHARHQRVRHRLRYVYDTDSQTGHQVFQEALSHVILKNPVKEGNSFEEVVLGAERARSIVLFNVVNCVTEEVVFFALCEREILAHELLGVLGPNIYIILVFVEAYAALIRRVHREAWKVTRVSITTGVQHFTESFIIIKIRVIYDTWTSEIIHFIYLFDFLFVWKCYVHKIYMCMGLSVCESAFVKKKKLNHTVHLIKSVITKAYAPVKFI